MDWQLLSNLAGGVGLFLLGMHLMTEGLRQAAGHSLKRALHAATESRLKGLLSGTLITAMVQSSSAVTVATIGFVNAGLLSISQSVAVIYGCNIGTSMTGWLVALVGFKIKISAFALPVIAAGMGLFVLTPKERWRHIGLALTGFGVFFIGLDFLKGSFDGLQSTVDIGQFSLLPFSTLLFVMAGFLLTVLMQASAASMAIALSLAATDTINLTSAAALVIGANMGTTSTAMLAVIGATANAKRIALAHVLFNLVTGAVGVLLLLVFQSYINGLKQYSLDPVLLLALFHTLFNVMGVIIMWPLTYPMVRILEHYFQPQQDDLSQPRFLDKNILTTPGLALEAMVQEMGRISWISHEMALAALSEEGPNPPKLEAEYSGVQQLVARITAFNQQIARQNLDTAIADTLPASLRVSGYLSEVARLAVKLSDYQSALQAIEDDSLQRQVYQFKQLVGALLQATRIDSSQATDSAPARQLLTQLELSYQQLKSAILSSASAGHLPPESCVALLDAVSHLRRLAQQAEKSSTHWSSMLPLQLRHKPSVQPPPVSTAHD